MNVFAFRVEVPFSPQWKHVDLLRTSLLNCLATVFESYDFCDKLGMVAAELVENAISYGDWRQSAAHKFHLSVSGDERTIQIEVANPVVTGSSTVDALFKVTDRIARAESPRQAYLDRLREIADRPKDKASQLGLLRIAYETECQLDVLVENDVVRVRATIASTAPWPPTSRDGIEVA